MVLNKQMIEEYILPRIHLCASCGNVRLLQNDESRSENLKFQNDYNLNTRRRNEMLLSLNIYDFSKSESDYNDNNETVYFFGKNFELDHIEKGPEIVSCYIKFVFKERKTGEMMLLISFHKANWTMEHPFKEE
ncbi:hypothetical protein [Clostridium sp.]|uniref:hypothetical protein n=1 Tax=Clostridium sp. TaxID=1506 RepID=UPI003217B4C8